MSGGGSGDATMSRARVGSDPAGWVDGHGDALFRYALSRLRDRERAEEVVQDTFLAALRGRESFGGRSSERTWLIGILRRKIVDVFRRGGADSSTLEADAPSLGGTDRFDERGRWVERVAAWPGAGGDVLERLEFRRVVDGCVSRLPEGLRAAFCLREMEGLETEEVCKVLDVSATNLWTQLHRARSLLRECLERRWFARQRERRDL